MMMVIPSKVRRRGARLKPVSGHQSRIKYMRMQITMICIDSMLLWFPGSWWPSASGPKCTCDRTYLLKITDRQSKTVFYMFWLWEHSDAVFEKSARILLSLWLQCILRNIRLQIFCLKHWNGEICLPSSQWKLSSLDVLYAGSWDSWPTILVPDLLWRRRMMTYMLRPTYGLPTRDIAACLGWSHMLWPPSYYLQGELRPTWDDHMYMLQPTWQCWNCNILWAGITSCWQCWCTAGWVAPSVFTWNTCHHHQYHHHAICIGHMPSSSLFCGSYVYAPPDELSCWTSKSSLQTAA